MAQMDTGLGWSAKDTWLTSGANIEVASLVEFVSALLPAAPTGSTVNDMRATDFWYRGDSGHYCLMAEPGVTLYVFYVGSKVIYTGSAQTSGAVWGSNGWYQGGSGTIYGTVGPSATDTTTGLLYGSITMPGSATKNTAIPTYSSISEGLATIIAQTTRFVKLNEGYAVACVAEWYTPEGTDLISPVLISTVPEYTEISTNGSTPSAAMTTFNFLYQGARFYMSIIGGNSEQLATTRPSPDLRQFGAAMPVKIFNLIAAESLANITVSISPDPYEENTEASTEEGGDGEDQEDDPVEEETLPVPSVAGHGFCTIYVPSAQELGQMASYLWSGSFDVTQVIKLFSNPMDSILGLSAVPVSLSGTSEQIYLGGVALTGITMPKYTGRTSVKVDFGTATIGERWGSYLDYEPYTEFSIYLPFIGIKPLKADDIMGKTISLMYNIDILSGGCVAYIRAEGGSVLYEWSGQCALQIPVTARNYDNVFQTAMSVVGAVGAAVVAPASAPVLSGAVASAAVQAAATKPRIERSGSVNGITGFLGQLRPYILRTIPEAFIPADQNKFIGYPAYINVNLANVVGYNEVDSIHLENVTATGAELEEIESILKGGVIF